MNSDSQQGDRGEQNDYRERGDGGGQPRVVQRVVMLQPGHNVEERRREKGIRKPLARAN